MTNSLHCEAKDYVLTCERLQEDFGDWLSVVQAVLQHRKLGLARFRVLTTWESKDAE